MKNIKKIIILSKEEEDLIYLQNAKNIIKYFYKISKKRVKMQEKYMKEALKEAKKAYEKKEVPVGCVIVKDDKIIARAHNLKESKNDTTKHAEIIAIQKASKKLNSWRLLDCEMYVTLEPCSMCAGAIINSRIKKIYIRKFRRKNRSMWIST